MFGKGRFRQYFLGLKGVLGKIDRRFLQSLVLFPF